MIRYACVSLWGSIDIWCMYTYYIHKKANLCIVYPNKEIFWIDSSFSTVLHNLERKLLYLRRSVPFSAQSSRLSPNPFPQDACLPSRKAICLLNFTHLFHFSGKDCSAKTCKTCECWSRKRDSWVYMDSWGGSVWSFFLAVTSQDHLMKCPSCHL